MCGLSIGGFRLTWPELGSVQAANMVEQLGVEMANALEMPLAICLQSQTCIVLTCL